METGYAILAGGASLGRTTLCTANNLNQYTEIIRGGHAGHPAFDADGTVTEMSYDRMGRLVRCGADAFVYDDYLNIGSTIWDPTEQLATRPLVWVNEDVPSYYFHDGNKNVSDVRGVVEQHYCYSPFGTLLDIAKQVRPVVQ